MGPMAKLGVAVVMVLAVWKFVTGPSQIQADVSYPLSYRTHVVGQAGSGDRLPLLVVLHGAGADEEDLDGVFADWQFPVRIVSFRGPARAGRGYTWSYGEGSTPEEANAVHQQMFREVAESLAVGAREVAARYPTEGKPMVFGFSRGASMAWYLGARHPERFDAIFTVSGELEQAFLEGLDPAIRPPFFAYHGRADPVVSLAGGKRTAKAIASLAGDVAFEEFDGGHTVPASVRADVEQKVKGLRGG